MINDKFYPLYNYILSAKDLSDCDKIVFSVIANLDREKGCTISNANLAQLCNKSQRTIIDSIGRLEKQGYITKTLTYTDKNNTLRTIKCTPIADICTPCENLHPLQDNVDTPCENLHAPPANIITPPVRNSAPKYNNNSIIDSKDNSIVAHEEEKPKKKDLAPPTYKKYLEQIKAEGENLSDNHKDLIRPFFIALATPYGEEKLYDIMLKNLKNPPYTKEIIQICEWAKDKNLDVEKVLIKFSNYTRKRKEKFTRLYLTLINWKFTTTEAGHETQQTQTPAISHLSRRF